MLDLLVKEYEKPKSSPNYLSMCQWLMFLDKPERVASILEKLLRSKNNNDALLAFQIAFDLVENEHQAFLLNVRDQLSSPQLQPPSEPALIPAESDTAQIGDATAAEDVAVSEENQPSMPIASSADPNEAIYAERLEKIKGILSGETSIKLTLQFLYSHNK